MYNAASVKSNHNFLMEIISYESDRNAFSDEMLSGSIEKRNSLLFFEY